MTNVAGRCQYVRCQYVRCQMSSDKHYKENTIDRCLSISWQMSDIKVSNRILQLTLYGIDYVKVKKRILADCQSDTCYNY